METKWFRWVLWMGLIVGACASSNAAEGSYKPYSISVEDVHGRTLRTYYHHGELFALGHYGERYNIRVTNHTARRVEAVVSVDGRDVISGRKGDYKKQRGYLVDPYDSILIEGFRTSMHGVAAFRFTSPSDSYSSRMGTPENVGVIGAAFFPERRRVRPRPRPLPMPRSEAKPQRRRRQRNPRGRPAPSAAEPSAPADLGSSGADTKGTAAASARSSRRPSYDYDYEAEESTNNIGTQYGEHRHSDVQEVRFVRASAHRPSRVVTLRYDDESGLLARGIEVHPHRHPHHPHPRAPEAFPMSRFAPPPPPSYR